MVTFTDGPAAGAVLALARAPIYLRVVIDSTDGKIDALDQLDDTPGPSEVVWVYRRTYYGGTVFACTRSGRGSGAYEVAEYELVPGDGERFRDTEAWQEWCCAQPEARPKAEAFGS